MFKQNIFGRTANGILLCCPYCGDDHCEVKGFKNFPGNDNYEAKDMSPSGVRGDVGVLSIESACGCQFDLVFGSHKGLTFVDTKLVKQCHAPKVPDCYRSPSAITGWDKPLFDRTVLRKNKKGNFIWDKEQYNIYLVSSDLGR